MDQKVNKARYSPPTAQYSYEEPEMLPAEKQAYTESVVKKLIYQMFERAQRGLSVIDFGSVQYKYMELWGIIDIDDFKQFIPEATGIDRAGTFGMFKILKPESRKENIESIAKLISVKELYSRYVSAKVHISAAFNQ